MSIQTNTYFETISFSALKRALSSSIARNFPDSLHMDAADDYWIQHAAIIMPWVLGGKDIDGGNASFNNMLSNKVMWESVLPQLIQRGWLTYSPQEGIYHLTYGDKGLDHAEISFGYDGRRSINPLVISDLVLFQALAPLYQGLGVPQAEMDELHSLISHTSGAESAIANFNTISKYTVIAVAAVVSGIGAYQAFSAPISPATGLPPAETETAAQTAAVDTAATGSPPSFLSEAEAFGEKTLIYGKYAASAIGTAETLGKEVGLIKPPERPVSAASSSPPPPESVGASNEASGAAIGIGLVLLLGLAFL